MEQKYLALVAELEPQSWTEQRRGKNLFLLILS